MKSNNEQSRCSKCNAPFEPHHHRHITREGIYHTSCYKEVPEEVEEKCLHNNIESNMQPTTCKDCGKMLDDYSSKEGVEDDWEERFDEKFTIGSYLKPEKEWDSFGNQLMSDALKDFIRSECLLAQKELLEAVLEKKHVFHSTFHVIGEGSTYCVLVKDIISIAKEREIL